MKKTDLTSYSNKAVKQLFGFNNEFNRMLPTSTRESVENFIKEKYLVTHEQMQYVLTEFIDKKP